MSTYTHNRSCPGKFLSQHTDAAKRVADTWNLHRIGDEYASVRKWFAVRMDDGSSDNVLYDNKQDAIRHQHHDEKFYTFLRIMPFTLTPCESEIYLVSARKFSDAGMRMADPDDRNGGRDVIKRSTWDDQTAQGLFLVNQNLILPN